ncbi:peroxiredoxin-like 2C isoform X2 [Acinonyx jubatus]|uniref:Peroxiredoxin-like 2C isoform X2 n=1 Tax=Acinonyx jubatus TaxID=32536 RepID=A0ABM3NNY1_ACIJB|nr:peroxiredoxin-like 2C isoform X2 [Acinonyx jubatus]
MLGAMADLALAPVTRQVSGRAAPAAAPSGPERGQPLAATVAELSVLDASGRQVPFGALFRERRVIVVFVRHFLCYICKEYVEDLAKIPKSFLQPFCKLTGYSHEIYVDPEREIYKKLGMKRGEEIAPSGKSPHIKSNVLSGSIQSLWRAVTGPLFDFQGDPAQQGGTLILGPVRPDRREALFYETESYRLSSMTLSHSFGWLVSIVQPVVSPSSPLSQYHVTTCSGNNIHFIHRDRNRLDHKPINSVLQLVGVQHVDFTSRSSVIHV